MFSKIDKNAVRKVRHHRQRRDINGTTERPRLNVYRSTNHIYAQVIDDIHGSTLASASTLDAEVKAQLEGKNKKDAAKIVGSVVGKRALEKGAGGLRSRRFPLHRPGGVPGSGRKRSRPGLLRRKQHA